MIMLISVLVLGLGIAIYTAPTQETPPPEVPSLQLTNLAGPNEASSTDVDPAVSSIPLSKPDINPNTMKAWLAESPIIPPSVEQEEALEVTFGQTQRPLAVYGSSDSFRVLSEDDSGHRIPPRSLP